MLPNEPSDPQTVVPPQREPVMVNDEPFWS